MVPKQLMKLDPGTPNCKQNGCPNNNKKQAAKKSSILQKNLKLGSPGAAKVRPNCEPRRIFVASWARNGPEVIPGSKKGRPRRPKGAKRFAKR